jgi:hypothetical protein
MRRMRIYWTVPENVVAEILGGEKLKTYEY